MKELMVTLLMIVSTGMVFGQQDDNNRFSTNGASSAMTRDSDFESSRKRSLPMVPIDRESNFPSAASTSPAGANSSSSVFPRPRGDSSFKSNLSPSTASETDSGTRPFAGSATTGETRFDGASTREASSGIGNAGRSRPGRSRFSNRDTTSVVQERPFRLAIQGPDLDALRRDGRIKASPRNPRTGELLPINGIIFDDSNEAENNKRTTAIEPVGFRDGEIVFSLTDDQILGLQNRTLYFDIPESARGQIEEIAVEYASYRAPRGFSEDPQNPVWNRGEQRDRSRLSSDRMTERDTVDARNRRRDGWNLPPRNDRDPLDPRRMVESDSEREARLVWERNRAEIARTRQLDEEKRRIEDQRREFELEKLRQSQELDRQWALQQQAARALQNQQTVPPSRTADLRNIYGQLNGTSTLGQPPVPMPQSWVPPSQPARADSTAVEVIAQQAKDIREANERLARLTHDNQSLLRQRNEQDRYIQAKARAEAGDSLRDRFSPSTDSQMEYFAGTNPRREVAPPETSSRAQMNVGGGSGRYNTSTSDRSGAGLGSQKSDSKNDVDNESNNKTQGMMLVLLVISVALNLYLWWLAQSFYSRYQDLADELRETFTATV